MVEGELHYLPLLLCIKYLAEHLDSKGMKGLIEYRQ